ncbi:Nn.00g035410.m01.CDS01 [Neocucurbitaria sp. VM-36]
MSYDPRPSARAYGAPGVDNGAAKKGSVRAARERMQVAQMRTQLPDTSRIIGLPQRPNQLVSQYSTQPRYEEPQQSPSPERMTHENMTSPPPQWPLPNDANDISATPVPPRSTKRLQPPQQSVRPVSDDYPIQQPSPGYPPSASPNYLQPPPSEYGVSYPSDEMFSPSSLRSSRPLTTSSAASEASSLGSIPDFPIPQPPASLQQARRVPSLGPPPSARRGPSSYYTQMSYVSPIAEESETRSETMRSRHGSYASSNVFPTNKDNFYPDDDLLSDDDETITSDRGTISPTEHDDNSGLVKQQPTLVRQASLGRRTKPSLMTIKSVDSFASKASSGKKKADAVGFGAGPAGAGLAMLAARNGVSQGSGSSTLSNGTGLIDPSSSSSESVDTLRYLKSKNAGSQSPIHPLQQETRPTTLADRVGMRRPPRLDVDAVRDAEARGSLTSLPDLIRRATRLAANLDRGKTASRLGLDFWETGAPEKKDTRQSGLSDMLAAFPPPGQDTPLRSGTPNVANNRMSKWPSAGIGSRTGMTDSGLSNEKPKTRRRCCGMPMWTFVTLLIVLLFIIAAAVIIPVVLVVLPNQNKSNGNAAQDGQGSNGSNNSNTNTPILPEPTAKPGANQCDGIITCQNSGVAILNSDRSCNCVCINGFTGRTCTNNDATGCTTTSISGAANNATMGSGIPRLIESAMDDFSIPLDATRILSIFSNLSLSCAAENALITFNGLASRSVSQNFQAIDMKHVLQPTRSLPVLHHPHPAHSLPQLRKRQTVGDIPVSNAKDSTQSGSTSAQPISSNVTALDFARVSVLLALQESGELDAGASAQEAIQSFLTSNRNGDAVGNTVNVDLFKVDLVDLTIEFKNGTTIRATPSPSSSSSSS